MKKTKPNYYRNGKVDVIDVVKLFDLNFNLGNVLKYIVRKGKKDAAKTIEDLEKAKEYLQREIDYLKPLDKKDKQNVLTKEQFNLVNDQAEEFLKNAKYLRKGQAFALALNKEFPKIYAKYKNTTKDPFYSDYLLPAFKNELYED